jgi:hypothetical protein
MRTQPACLDEGSDEKPHDHQETDGEFFDDPSRRCQTVPQEERPVGGRPLPDFFY